MRALIFVVALGGASTAFAQTPPGGLWSELKARREKISEIHQEFQFTRTFKLASGDQASRQQLVLDLSAERWRERSISGSSTRVRIFDGKDTLLMDDGGSEFVRIKRSAGEEPLPPPYNLRTPVWAKAVEVERKSCGFAGKQDECVLVSVPLRPSVRGGPAGLTKMTEGNARIRFDLENGLIISLASLELIETPRTRYLLEMKYQLQRMTYGGKPDPSLFSIPAGSAMEVKELARWNAATIKKQLIGKPAPEWDVADMAGKPVDLSAFKGRTVLLDFWTTWCPPCRADGPALDKLYRKYGDRELTIVGVSVSEERAIVEKFLKEHPHNFPVVLTSENEMPRAWQIGVFPTYVVIDKDGTVSAAVEGDQGFSELRRLLKKAGLEVD